MTTPYPDHSQLTGSFASIRMECDLHDVITRGDLPRDGSVADRRWVETGLCYVFHPMNAYTVDNKIISHVMQFEEAPLFPHVDGSPPDPKKANTRLCKWVIDLAEDARGVERRYLDDITGEFPRPDERFAGLSYGHGYDAASTNRQAGLGFNTLAHHDCCG